MADLFPETTAVEAAKPEREPYVYRCSKHKYVMESTAPRMAASLKVFCPLCKDEWMAKHLDELQNENPKAGTLKEASNAR